MKNANKQNVPGGVVHSMPDDLEDALMDEQPALELWKKLTPLARNEWICWVTFPKQNKTREEHVKRAINELKEGKKRPCCWLGCTHRTDKAISPSVKSILKKRQRM